MPLTTMKESSSSPTVEKSGEMPVPQPVSEAKLSSSMEALSSVGKPVRELEPEPEPSSIVEQSSSTKEKQEPRKRLRWWQKGLISFQRKYDRDFKEVEELYNNGDWHGVIEAAKYNLTDPTLPRWHIIRYHLMWAHAAEWYAETEEHRLIAEEFYAEAVRLTPQNAWPQEFEALRRLRKDLNNIKEAQEEDLKE